MQLSERLSTINKDVCALICKYIHRFRLNRVNKEYLTCYKFDDHHQRMLHDGNMSCMYRKWKNGMWYSLGVIYRLNDENIGVARLPKNY